MSLKKYTKTSFPKTRYVPGQGSHPDEGHLPHFSKNNLQLTAQNWKKMGAYLFGIDLFNHAYWWETHEVFERIWLEVGKKSPVGVFIQGIIQVAAALLKLKMGEPKAANILYKKGLDKMSSQSGVYLGVDVSAFKKDMVNYFDKGEKTVPVIVLKI